MTDAYEHAADPGALVPHSADCDGAYVTSHSPSAETVVPLQRTGPMVTEAPCAKARARERRTSGVEEKRVREKAVALAVGRATPPHTACIAARTTAGFATAAATLSSGDAPASSPRSRAVGAALAAALRRASVALTLTGPRPSTERDRPFADTTTTSSNTGHSVAVTETFCSATPIAEPSEPVSAQESTPTKLGDPYCGSSWTARGTGASPPPAHCTCAVADGAYAMSRGGDGRSAPAFRAAADITLHAIVTSSCAGTCGQRLKTGVNSPGGSESDRRMAPSASAPPPPDGGSNPSAYGSGVGEAEGVGVCERDSPGLRLDGDCVGDATCDGVIDRLGLGVRVDVRLGVRACDGVTVSVAVMDALTLADPVWLALVLGVCVGLLDVDWVGDPVAVGLGIWLGVGVCDLVCVSEGLTDADMLALPVPDGDCVWDGEGVPLFVCVWVTLWLRVPVELSDGVADCDRVEETEAVRDWDGLPVPDCDRVGDGVVDSLLDCDWLGLAVADMDGVPVSVADMLGVPLCVVDMLGLCVTLGL